ncbi:hypothetical protein GC093_17025 [Paenibacillus sp. LMG 31456]|uniref:Uncharacterized protein n=1 Tax=Paenibacillus foliorum TaxID=2654974 RepID=A0A972K0Q5_9BACL|nr:hypothetical protein [Paenibacillus foliorum]NOU94911.1 hypothetical protein [Paenibacillus foliorum]
MNCKYTVDLSKFAYRAHIQFAINITEVVQKSDTRTATSKPPPLAAVSDFSPNELKTPGNS